MCDVAPIQSTSSGNILGWHTTTHYRIPIDENYKIKGEVEDGFLPSHTFEAYVAFAKKQGNLLPKIHINLMLSEMSFEREH